MLSIFLQHCNNININVNINVNVKINVNIRLNINININISINVDINIYEYTYIFMYLPGKLKIYNGMGSRGDVNNHTRESLIQRTVRTTKSSYILYTLSHQRRQGISYLSSRINGRYF